MVSDHQPLIGDAVINGGPGLMLIVEKLPWGNTLDVTRGVEEALERDAPGLPGIEIDTTIFRPATFIETSIDNLGQALLLGCLLVMLVLRRVPLRMAHRADQPGGDPAVADGRGAGARPLGATINTMILAGLVIAVGVVVDDAIIDIENIVRRLRQHRREGSTSVHRARSSSTPRSRCAAPIIYATLIIIASAVPVFFLEGLAGSFFRPLALAYTLAVLASMVVALTVTPALALILLRKAPLDRREPPLIRWLQRGYARAAGASSAGRAGPSAVAVIVLAAWPCCRGSASRCFPTSRSATS